MSTARTEYDFATIRGANLTGATLDEENSWPVRSTEDEAWLDAIMFGRGFYREPCEALASRDPGR